MAETRANPRNRSLLRGTVVYSEGRHSFPCSIRDWSDTGARITFPVGQLFPSQLFLVNTQKGTGHKAEVVWAGSTQAGLKFLATFGMNDVPTDLAYLRRFGATR
jgi:hypothetical protein